MIKRLLFLCALTLVFSCKEKMTVEKEEVVLWEPYNDSVEVASNANHENSRMRYKLIQSKVLDKNEVFLPLYEEVSQMTDVKYEALKPKIIEQNIFQIRKEIEEGNMTYEDLTLFYLYRIYKYELYSNTTLNTVIALNKDVINQAKKLDELRMKDAKPLGLHPIYGMPILVKDNINTKGMKTTGGAIALMNNEVEDSFIVERLKYNGALILGKVNLSEWAYYLCKGCPLG